MKQFVITYVEKDIHDIEQQIKALIKKGCHIEHISISSDSSKYYGTECLIIYTKEE